MNRIVGYRIHQLRHKCRSSPANRGSKRKCKTECTVLDVLVVTNTVKSLHQNWRISHLHCNNLASLHHRGCLHRESYRPLCWEDTLLGSTVDEAWRVDSLVYNEWECIEHESNRLVGIHAQIPLLPKLCQKTTGSTQKQDLKGSWLVLASDTRLQLPRAERCFLWTREAGSMRKVSTYLLHVRRDPKRYVTLNTVVISTSSILTRDTVIK